MNKKIKNFLISFFFLCLITNVGQASLFWKLDYGIKLFKKNNFESASDYFMDYINSNPNDEEGYYWLARTYYNLKDTKKAEEYFKKAYEISLKEKNIEKIEFSLNNTSNIEDYFDMAAMYFESGNLEQAEVYADLMLKINPKSSSAYFIKAKIAQINGNNEKAVELLNKAIFQNNKLIKTNLAKTLNIRKLPEMTLETYEVRALEAYFSNDIEGAIKFCKKYLNVNPANVDISNLLIDLYIKNGEFGLAQNLINEILNDSNNVETLLYQAKIYQLKKEKERYETTLLNAFKMNPNNQKVILELGNYYLSIGDFIQSKKYFESLISINDVLYEGYFGHIYLLLEYRKIDEAMNLIRKFILLNPDSSEGDFLLAKICEKKGEYKEALNYIDSALNKAQNAQYYIYRAYINNQLRNYEEAIEDINFALKMPNLNINIEKTNNFLIENYLKNGDIVNAQMRLNNKSELDKNGIMYKYNLYVIYKLQGNEKMAVKQLGEAIKTKPVVAQDFVDLSKIYYEKQKVSEAIKILDKGIKKFPQEFILYSQKSEILFKLNKQNEAKAVFDKINN